MKNHRLINTFSLICCIAYIFAFLSNCFAIENADISYQLLYDKLLQEAGYFNSVMELSKTNIETEIEKPMFYSAKVAIDFAFKKIYEAQTFHIQTSGQVVAGAMGVDATVLTQGDIVKYDKNTYLTKTLRFEKENTLGFSLGQTQGDCYYYKNGQIYIDTTKDISYNASTNEINGVFKNKYSLNSAGNFCTYIINNETISKELYFSVNYNAYTGKIESYSASVMLDTKKAVKGLDEQIKKEGGMNELPQFSQLKINCVIDKNGFLKTASIFEEYSASKKIPILGSQKFKSKDEFVWKVISFNKQPKILQPNV